VRKFRVLVGSIGAALVLAAGGSFAQQDRSDPHFQSGYREGNPLDDPADRKNLDALERIKKRGKFVVCADPNIYPQSDKAEPPGFDIEIMREIAKRSGWRFETYWTDTGTRGGLGRALRQSILQGSCDVFAGLAIGGTDDEIAEKKMAYTAPYIGLGYVLVVQGKAAGAKSLQEIKERNVKIGVSMSTPMDDYLFEQEIPRELFLGNRRIVDALEAGKLDAAMVWITTLAESARDKTAGTEVKFGVAEGFVPQPKLRWNGAFALMAKDKDLKKHLDDMINTLIKEGRIKAIVEPYGIPYYPPFS
jgi:ABC-type amino acid transport substrate-binding protein